MAIEWGSYDNHLRVGIDVTISPSSPSYSDTTVKVTWTFYADTDGWNFDDNNETYHYWGTGFDDTWSFDNHMSGSAVKVGSHSENYGISSNSGTASAHAHLYGTYNGASPTQDRTVNLPNRPSPPPPPPPTITTPSAGEAPTAGSITSTSAVISWGPVDDNGGATVDEYQLEVDTSSSFSSPNYNVTFNESGSASHSVTGLSPNTKYYARVRAHNSAGWGDWTSSTYCPFTTAGDKPDTPATISLTKKTTTSLTYSWGAVNSHGGGTVTYTIQRADDVNFTTNVATATQTATSRTSDTLAPDTTYFFRVKATNSVGDSGWSPSASFSTVAPNPAGFDDEGDLLTLINNLSHAVGDKLVRLGSYNYRYHGTQITMPNATTVYVNMGSTPTVEHFRGPDEPSYLGADASDMLINYPGTYLIEFGFHWPFANLTSGHGTQTIYVNGTGVPSTATQKFGITEYIESSTNRDGSSVGLHTTRHVVHLDAGDTVGFAVWQDTGASATTGTSEPVIAYSRITMIGF